MRIPTVLILILGLKHVETIKQKTEDFQPQMRDYTSTNDIALPRGEMESSGHMFLVEIWFW